MSLWGRYFITSTSLTPHLFLLGLLKLNLMFLLDQLRLKEMREMNADLTFHLEDTGIVPLGLHYGV